MKAILSEKQRKEILRTLQARFAQNMNRHRGLAWAEVQARLEAQAEKLWSLHEMERTGGEPDVIGQEKKSGEYIFYDCAAESPKDRRSLCYDRDALQSRKDNKPRGNAMEMAAAMGIDLLTEEQYRELQKLGEFDIKPRAGLKLLLPSESSVGPCFVTAATTRSSCITTALNPIMPRGDSVGASLCKFARA